MSPEDVSFYTLVPRCIGVPETTFADSDWMTFPGVDALELCAARQLSAPMRTIVECCMPIGFEGPVRKV